MKVDIQPNHQGEVVIVFPAYATLMSARIHEAPEVTAIRTALGPNLREYRNKRGQTCFILSRPS
jgi:hypothetical protein